MTATDSDIGYLIERMEWLVRLRWIAAGGVLIVVAFTGALGIVRQIAPLVGLTLALGLYNCLAWWRSRACHRQAAPPQIVSHLFWQLVGDLVFLSLFFHWSGGMTNPFSMFFAFPLALGAMLLPPPLPLYLGLIAATVHGLAVLGEFSGVLAHHSLFAVGPGGGPPHPALVWRTPLFVLGYLLAFNLMLFGVIYFVRSVVERQRRADALRMKYARLALSREHLARIGEVAVGVAHTVRNPLHGLISSVDLLLEEGAFDAATKNTLSLMGDACRRIERATQKLLVLYRDAPIAKKPVPLKDLVQEACKMASLRARGSAGQVQEKTDAVGLVEVDPDRLSEALINVLDNALDACRDGGMITVRTAERDGVVCIEVADTGPGIPLEDLGRVFDPFFTTKPVGEGSGLGLAITRHVVEEHGGSVEIESNPGAGTTVRLLLPRATDLPEEHHV